MALVFDVKNIYEEVIKIGDKEYNVTLSPDQQDEFIKQLESDLSELEIDNLILMLFKEKIEMDKYNKMRLLNMVLADFLLKAAKENAETLEYVNMMQQEK